MKKGNYKKFINVDELIFDCTIFLFFFLINYFKTDNSIFIESINKPVLFFLLFLTVFFSPMYLSAINSRFSVYKHDLLNKILIPVSFIVTLSTSLFIVYAMPYYLVEYFNSFFFTSFFFINLFSGIIALIIGWHIGSNYENDKIDSKKLSIGIFTYLSPLIVILPIFSTALLYEYSKSWYISLAFGIVILIFSQNFIKSGNDRLNDFFKSSLARNYVFPFIMAFMLSFAHELIDNVFIMKNRNESALAVLESLIISGILPTRIILLLSPPRKILNVLTGLCSLVILFFNIIKTF